MWLDVGVFWAVSERRVRSELEPPLTCPQRRTATGCDEVGDSLRCDRAVTGLRRWTSADGKGRFTGYCVVALYVVVKAYMLTYDARTCILRKYAVRLFIGCMRQCNFYDFLFVLHYYCELLARVFLSI